jgi:hypothetical protein
METHLPSPTTGRVYVSLPEGMDDYYERLWMIQKDYG